MQKIIVAIVDTLTQDIVGPLQMYPHPAPAVRMFGDVIMMQGSQVGAHPKDYELRCLGTIDNECKIAPWDGPDVLITAEAWVAAQTKKEGGE